MSFIKNSIFGTFRDPCPSLGKGQRYKSELRPEHEEQDGRAEHGLHPLLRQLRRQSARLDDGGQSLLQKASTHRSWR